MVFCIGEIHFSTAVQFPVAATYTPRLDVAYLALAVGDESATQLRVLDGVRHNVVPHDGRLGAAMRGLADREVIDLRNVITLSCR